MTTGHFPRAGWGWGSSGATGNPWDTLVDTAMSHTEHLPAASRSPAVDAQPQNPPPKASPSTCLELQNTSWHPKGRRPHCQHHHRLLFVLSNLGGARARHVQRGRWNEPHPSFHILLGSHPNQDQVVGQVRGYLCTKHSRNGPKTTEPQQFSLRWQELPASLVNPPSVHAGPAPATTLLIAVPSGSCTAGYNNNNSNNNKASDVYFWT